jgi:hypothetical protein
LARLDVSQQRGGSFDDLRGISGCALLLGGLCLTNLGGIELIGRSRCHL